MIHLKRKKQERSRRVLVAIAMTIAISLIEISCRKEHVAPVNQLVKDLFCFKADSEWTYYDSVSHTTQKMVVKNYEILKFGGDKPKRGKVYNFVESIRINATIEDSKIETMLDAVHKDNTAVGYVATPTQTYFSICCDENNNFTPPATHLNIYTVNETTYFDVYLFNKGDITYYVSNHTGFIRCMKDNNFDLVLIDKNVKQ